MGLKVSVFTIGRTQTHDTVGERTANGRFTYSKTIHGNKTKMTENTKARYKKHNQGQNKLAGKEQNDILTTTVPGKQENRTTWQGISTNT